ncbi:MAG TPA: phosphotriesterase-related protein, partial [Dehalococcoidia bacterium]|nr:phosphotriesterase-related protein [Dehalococcoidia bacterium]
SPGLRDQWPDTFDRTEAVRLGVAKLTEAKANGIDTMVDLTTIDLGRDVPLFAEIVRQVEMQVIVATGIWRQVPRFFHLRSPDVAADLFVRDITQGIQGTGIRAGIIKCATDDTGVTEPIEIALRASARAHRRTGVPISTHTDAEKQVGLDQQRIFAEEGVDLTRVVIGHSGDTENLDYLKKVADAGSYLGMDRFGLHNYLPTDRRVQVVAALCKQGYADRMVLSHDASCHSDSRTPEYLAKRFPDWRYTHIPQDVIPALLEAGVTQAQIDQMTRENPRRIFERTGAY